MNREELGTLPSIDPCTQLSEGSLPYAFQAGDLCLERWPLWSWRAGRASHRRWFGLAPARTVNNVGTPRARGSQRSRRVSGCP